MRLATYPCDPVNDDERSSGARIELANNGDHVTSTNHNATHYSPTARNVTSHAA